MTRTEHLEWAKARALEYVERGELQEAYTSLGTDLMKHPELENHDAIREGMLLLMTGHLSTREEMRKFVEGCQ